MPVLCETGVQRDPLVPIIAAPTGSVNAPPAYAKAALVSLVKESARPPQKWRGEPPGGDTTAPAGKEEEACRKRRWSGFRPNA